MNGSLVPFVNSSHLVPYNLPYHVIDSPETELARRVPQSTISLLDRESKRKYYVRALEVGAGVITKYLEGLPREDHAELSRITVFPEKVKRKFFNLFRGNKFMEINFHR